MDKYIVGLFQTSGSVSNSHGGPQGSVLGPLFTILTLVSMQQKLKQNTIKYSSAGVI